MNQKSYPSPMLDVRVVRINPTTVEVSWHPQDQTPSVAVCTGLRKKEAMEKIPVPTSHQGYVRITHLDSAKRHYYHIIDESGKRVLTAERRVLFDGAVNFRDIGGYRTTDGREIKWGKVFRSDGLSRLTENDHQILSHLGVSRIFDFRTPSEVRQAPDNLPETEAITWVNLPVTHGKIDFVDAMSRLKQGEIDWLTPDFMVNGYLRNLEEFPGVWGEVINYMARANDSALLFHCTGGKDRTGTCAALILLMLGVDEETVIMDHQLSNVYIADILPKVLKMIAAYGVDPDRLVPYLTAPREGITALLDHLRTRYGSAADYLSQRAGVQKETQELLKEKLLR